VLTGVLPAGLSKFVSGVRREKGKTALQAQASQQAGGRRRGGPKQPNNGGLGRAIRYLGKQKRTTLIAYGALLVATIAQLAVPQLLQNMIDSVTNGAIANGVLSAPAFVQAWQDT
jgi:hypothetical protein